MVHAGTNVEMVMAVFEAADDRCEDVDFSRPWPMKQVAADGIPFEQHWERDWLFSAPGYRLELLVQMPEEETTLCFLSGAASTSLTTEGVDLEDVGDYLLFSVKVTSDAGEATLSALPSDDSIDEQLASVARPTEWVGTVDGVDGVDVSCDSLDEGPLAETQQPVVMVHPVTVLQTEDYSKEPSAAGECDGESGHGGGGEVDPCTCPLPNLNCRNFGPRQAYETEDGRGYRNDRVLPAGSSERWDLSATDAHPYHIHINPFVVCPASSNKEAPFPHWRDTYFVQFDDLAANDFAPVSLLAEYASEFTGQFVFHCHKLNHEDEGMMEKIEVCAPGDVDCMCMDGETDTDGACVTASSGCYEGDTQCRYAEYLMSSFGPATLRDDPIPNTELSAEARNDLLGHDLEECCGDFPELGSESELIDYIAALTGIAPACCPDDLTTAWPPGHPCDDGGGPGGPGGP